MAYSITPNGIRVHIDYAGPIDGQYLLLFVDAYTKFLDAITPTISANVLLICAANFFPDTGL